jgi:DNA-binding GntR family transcriptional regulator
VSPAPDLHALARAAYYGSVDDLDVFVDAQIAAGATVDALTRDEIRARGMAEVRRLMNRFVVESPATRATDGAHTGTFRVYVASEERAREIASGHPERTWRELTPEEHAVGRVLNIG